MSKLQDLMDERQELLDRLVDIKTELEEEFRRVNEITTELAKDLGFTIAEQQHYVEKRLSPKVKEDSKKVTLKTIIIGLLRKDGPQELIPLVSAIKSMIARGEYKSKAAEISPNVQQMIHQLRQEGLVKSEKNNSNNRTVYSFLEQE